VLAGLPDEGGSTIHVGGDVLIGSQLNEGNPEFAHRSMLPCPRCPQPPAGGDQPLRRLLVSTTSKSVPVRFWIWWNSSSFQRLSGTPLIYQGDPLSARIMP